MTRDGAVGFISLKEGDGEGLEHFDDDHERLFVYYSQQEFIEVLSRNGFSAVEFMRYPDPENTKTVWLCFFVRKLPEASIDKSAK